MRMNASNPNNIWRVSTAKGESYFVKCPSKSGAKIYLAGQIGIKGNTPLKAELYLEEQIPQGETVMQAEFLAANDMRNWNEKGRV